MKMTTVVLATAMLNVCAQQLTVEAAGAADQRQADSSVPSESEPTGGVSFDLARGLIGHWTFDDGKGMIARDSSSKGNDYPVLIGENAQKKGRHFHGLIDDVRIYDRALCPQCKAVCEVKVAGWPPATLKGTQVATLVDEYSHPGLV